MAPSISEVFHSFPERGFPARQAAEYLPHYQNEFYFQLSVLKTSRVQALREYFSRAKVEKLLLGSSFATFDYADSPWPLEYLDQSFFGDTDPAVRAQKREYLRNAVVIVTNNDVGRNGVTPHYADFFCQCPNTVFIGWDWDNHHWLDVSTFLAAHSDLYVPAHHENLYPLTRYNWLTVGPIYAATNQWSKAFLSSHREELVKMRRSDDPLGKHFHYAPFHFRNQVITTLSGHYPSVSFSDRTFHVKTPEEKLLEWDSHKAHWIVPVLNDVPIRMFDALITGGIPILPESLRFLPPVCDIPGEHVLFYSPLDIVDPKRIVAKANEIFDRGGAEKILERHRYALEHHHCDQRLNKMLGSVKDAFGVDF